MQHLDLSGIWSLEPKDRRQTESHTPFFLDHQSVPCRIPGDIHSALLEKRIIADPYWGRNEREVQWVGRSDWTLSRAFTVTGAMLAHTAAVLTFTMADTIIEARVNGVTVGKMDNMFSRHRFVVTSFLHEGENTLTLLFSSSERVAGERAKALPYPIPCSAYPSSSPNRNLIRKAQCQSGWDWGPCILAMGLYEAPSLDFIDVAQTESVTTSLKRIGDSSFSVSVTVSATAYREGTVPLSVTLAGKERSAEVSCVKGKNTFSLTLDCDGVSLWWPAGEGLQPLYPLTVVLDGQVSVKRVGFRTLSLVANEESGGGKSMFFRVNGRDIFAKGMNWIPLDALPSRMTRERYDGLLSSCVDAHMNMLRLWGGGMFEHDDFYDLCDEKGILIWHDLMFACALYPSSPSFLASVEDELRYQVPRLMDHPSLALWCGNNEALGAIGWYEESKNNPARYVVDYDRLTHGTAERVVTELDGNHTFWPSSPSAGPNDFSDNWHRDDRGDMHYWSVWHEGKPFEAYYDVKPRFVSEFGYQSFPSLSTIESFAPEGQRNVTSPIMEHHQKNPRGNALIIDNFSRYFRFPSGLGNMVYLSQAQQAYAMKMAVEFWRTTRPRCMGTLIWQLNDNWPVSSWSAIEYGGKWKILQYAARHFYSPVLPVAYRSGDGRVRVFVVNDTNETLCDAALSVECSSFLGEKQFERNFVLDLKGEASTPVCSLEKELLDPLREDCFLSVTLSHKGTSRENTLLLDIPKQCNLEDPGLTFSVSESKEGPCVTFEAKRPAFWVSLDAGSLKGRFSDSWFSVYPSREKRVLFRPGEEMTIEKFRENLKVYDLYGSSRDS